MQLKQLIQKKRILLKILIITPLVVVVGYLLYSFGVEFIKLFKHKPNFSRIAYLNENNPSIDSTFNALKVNEKIGQLIMIDFGNVNDTIFDNYQSIVKKIPVGGVRFHTKKAVLQLHYLHQLQKIVSLPFFNALQTNNGSIDFLDSIVKFPTFESFFACNKPAFFSEFASIVNEQMDVTLLNCNFLPRMQLSIKDRNDTLYMKSLLQNYMAFYRKQLNKKIINFLECYGGEAINDTTLLPKKYDVDIIAMFCNKGMPGIAISIDDNQGLSFSAACDFVERLRKTYRYEGMVLFQLPNKKHVNEKDFSKAIQAGVDLFFTPIENAIPVFETLQKCYQNSKIDKNMMDISVMKILKAKTWMNKPIVKTTNADSLRLIFNHPKNEFFAHKITEKSITIVRNDSNLLPLSTKNSEKLLCLSIGKDDYTAFRQYIAYYSKPKYEIMDSAKIASIIKAKSPNIWNEFKTIILVINSSNQQISNAMLHQINQFTEVLNKKHYVVVVHFGSPIQLQYMKHHNLVQVYDFNKLSQKLTAQLIFGAFPAHGGLPYSINDSLPFQKGIKQKKAIRLKYTIPQEVGLTEKLNKTIDSIIYDAIRKGAFPGCQVFVAINQKVIHLKSYGYHTFQKNQAVKWNDVYDIASITKVAATTLAAMKLYEEGKIQLGDKLEKFFKNTKIDYSNIKPDTIINIDTLYFSDNPDFEKILKAQDTLNLNDSMFIAFDTIIVTATPKLNIFKVKLAELLTHQSGISPSLPITPFIRYEDNTKDNFTTYFSSKKTANSTTQIAENFYLNNNYKDTLWEKTKQLKVYSRKIYQYTDINMILLYAALDSIDRKKPLCEYLDEKIYQPLGLQTLTFLPLKKLPKNQIIPTTEDAWRKQTLQGYVHDPSAAILGGVAGNAGLFSNANDLGILFQMLLNKGTYGDVQFFRPQTVTLFTQKQADGYRGYGFDKPCRKNIIAPSASPETFGHTGFTGTCVWVDPKYQLVFVFLSNRVNPSEKNWKINSLQVRQKVHQAIYDALKQNVQVEENKKNQQLVKFI